MEKQRAIADGAWAGSRCFWSIRVGCSGHPSPRTSAAVRI